ncbi:hypothetical protein ETD86_44490 [Nonomuraea turkmeniaca]|uniref:Uncharacterized protein n=1 Tax=Nonomuraea turkmeniaca TaxID=103838 RepID=A0A5S4EZZ0_9ACTN|nr:hypothetical protein [Nonomuraea turkmeniaca]TMR09214.1 hypothetical protein ETD86_44490 [Nonomuraea turkmeniaca]
MERVAPALPTDRYEAARFSYIDSLREGKQRLGRRPLMSRWGLEQREAEEIIADVERERAQAAETKGAEAPVAEAGIPSPDGTRTSATSEVDAA